MGKICSTARHIQHIVTPIGAAGMANNSANKQLSLEPSSRSDHDPSSSIVTPLEKNECNSSTKTPRRALDLTDETDSDNGEHDTSVKRPRTCEDQITVDDDDDDDDDDDHDHHDQDHDEFDRVGRKGKKQQQYKTPQNNKDTVELTQRDLTVFMKGCHRSLTNFIKDKWTGFEKEFRTKFHAPTSFKVVGHCLKIVCINPQQRKVLLQCEEMCKEAVKVTIPFGMMRKGAQTTRKYVINDVPTSFTDQDIATAVGAEAARRIISGRTGSKQPTGVVILDIKGPPPNTVNIGTLIFNLKDYIPRPARCTRCNSFNHRQHQCIEKQRCVRCNSDQHLSIDCPLTNRQQYRCKNCNGAHSAAFKGCPVYQEIQQILRVKTKQGVTLKEAAQQVHKEEEEDENQYQDQQQDEQQDDTLNTDTAVSLAQESTSNGKETQQYKAKATSVQQRSSVSQESHRRQSSKKHQQSLQSRQKGKSIKSTSNTIQHTQMDAPSCSGTATNKSKNTQQPDNNATLLILMYELSRHMKEIAHLISYSRLPHLQHVSDTLLDLGNTIFGHDFSSQLKQ